MVDSGKRWTVQDCDGNSIYLTEERWRHIIAAENHPEMAGYEHELTQTIQRGSRNQDSLNPRKYRYIQSIGNLPLGNTHIVAIVLFTFRENKTGQPEPNYYIVTAYQKEIG